MRIRRLDLYRATLPLESGGFSHSGGAVAALEEVFVKLTADDGLVGWGEVRGNMGYFSGEHPEGILAVVRDVLAPAVVGRDVWDAGGVIDRCHRAVVGNGAAKAVLDIALHDLAARAAGQPLVRWLGGPRRPEVSGSQCVFFGPPAVAAETARRHRASGFRVLKVRVGLEPFERDVERVAAIREAVGDDVSLAVDANQAWSVKEAIRRVRVLETFGVEAVEQPVAARDLTGMAEVAQAVSVPVIADESLLSLEDAATLVRLGGAGMFHVKLVKSGGIRKARRVIALAEAARIPYVMGQMNEGMLATVAAAHLALASAPKYAELYGTDGIVHDPTPGTVHAGSRIVVPDGPGLGTAPDESALTPVWSLAA